MFCFLCVLRGSLHILNTASNIVASGAKRGKLNVKNITLNVPLLQTTFAVVQLTTHRHTIIASYIIVRLLTVCAVSQNNQTIAIVMFIGAPTAIWD